MSRSGGGRNRDERRISMSGQGETESRPFLWRSRANAVAVLVFRLLPPPDTPYTFHTRVDIQRLRRRQEKGGSVVSVRIP
ncbi:hypothetical protein VTH06DRAFT_1016 [Thermothelomyces fergusii]